MWLFCVNLRVIIILKIHFRLLGILNISRPGGWNIFRNGRCVAEKNKNFICFFTILKKIDFNPVHSVYLIWIFVVVVVVDFVVVVLAVVDGIVVVVLSVVDGIVVKLSVVDGIVLFSIKNENFKNWFVILLYLYPVN